jgi:hypothetical protein
MGKRKEVKLEGPIEETDQKIGIGGLGDLVSAITSTLGIEPCDECIRRRQEFNRSFPWMKTTRELTEEEVIFMREKVNSTHTLENDTVNRLFKLYNEMFSQKLERCNCPGLVSRIIERVNVFMP